MTKRTAKYVRGSYERFEDGSYTQKMELEYHKVLREAGYDMDNLKERGLCVHHIDGDANNNSLENLEILTYAEHAERHQNGSFYRRYDILYIPEGKTYSILEFERKFNLVWLAQSVKEKIRGKWGCKGIRKNKPYKNISQLTLYKESLLDNCIIGGRPEKKALGVGRNVNYKEII